MLNSRSIEDYSAFSELLKETLKGFHMSPISEWVERAKRAVDGQAADELRRLVKLETRRNFGAFFTPSILASKVAKELFPKLDNKAVIYDPAAGAGNLLLAGLDYLNEANIVPITEHFLLGTDIHKEFISTANSRLQIRQLMLQEENAMFRYPRFDVHLMDGLIPNRFYSKATHIFVNPPFNLIFSPEDINWSNGKVSAAAIFIQRIIEYVQPGTTITAILPEVLRSGSRYHAWRGMVLDNCVNEKVELLGQFDKHADVDVFGILLRKRVKTLKRKSKINRLVSVPQGQITVNDKFFVSVGPVVDNRDKHIGKRRGYIISKGLPGWSVQKKFSQARNHQGKSFEGPFIVIKRTSRMGESQRAIATIIKTPRPVYVDNHLIILQPKSGTLKDCGAMMENLKDPRTDKWLNDEIRCRHLTVKIVSRIPIWE